MAVQNIDLTAARLDVKGNLGDDHTFRLSNPTGQPLIAPGGEYEAVFSTPGKTTVNVELDLSELADGILVIPIEIRSGTYYVRRLNPDRTLLEVAVTGR